MSDGCGVVRTGPLRDLPDGTVTYLAACYRPNCDGVNHEWFYLDRSGRQIPVATVDGVA